MLIIVVFSRWRCLRMDANWRWTKWMLKLPKNSSWWDVVYLVISLAI